MGMTDEQIGSKTWGGRIRDLEPDLIFEFRVNNIGSGESFLENHTPILGVSLTLILMHCILLHKYLVEMMKN